MRTSPAAASILLSTSTAACGASGLFLYRSSPPLTALAGVLASSPRSADIPESLPLLLRCPHIHPLVLTKHFCHCLGIPRVLARYVDPPSPHLKRLCRSEIISRLPSLVIVV
ncbi:hypothetical protein B0H14DRAFT_2682150 [Mycena olivaceomarginata]|nr:hypothetical protein B0H14DRAFT_2682150 [Mycena olivaceomarginata]